MGDLAGKAAIVTGGSRGIGRAIALKLASEGTAVAVCSRTSGAAEVVAAEIEELGVRALAQRTDVSDSGQAEALVKAAQQIFGRLDILVNNAGVTIGGQTIADTAVEDWARVMDVNANSVFYTCRAAVTHLRRRGGGNVINISSNVINTLPGASAAYAASKSAVVVMTKVLSKEEARHGIRVNAVSPGMIAAGMGLGAMERRAPESRQQFLNTIPLGREGEASEVAAAVVFLVSDEASYITGQNFNVNGGDRTESYQ